MKSILAAALAGALVLASVSAEAQKTQRIRGTITAVASDALSVKTIDGKEVKLRLTDKTTVAAAKALKLSDLKPGTYVGSTTTQRADGALVASEVHTIAPTVKPGHGPWDRPGTMMTNANVVSVVQAAGGEELTLEYKGGSKKILVPPGTPIVTTTKADRSYLKAGEYVFAIARPEDGGGLTALRIQVSRDGVKPPQ
jgi:hypothetical protein